MVGRLAHERGLIFRALKAEGAAACLRYRGRRPRRALPTADRGRRARKAPAVLMTAHHRDDQAETFLLRLARGSGVYGLAAMAVDTEREGMRIARPLLGLRRADLAAVVAAAGLEPAVDPQCRPALCPREAEADDAGACWRRSSMRRRSPAALSPAAAPPPPSTTMRPACSPPRPMSTSPAPSGSTRWRSPPSRRRRGSASSPASCAPPVAPHRAAARAASWRSPMPMPARAISPGGPSPASSSTAVAASSASSARRARRAAGGHGRRALRRRLGRPLRRRHPFGGRRRWSLGARRGR